MSSTSASKQPKLSPSLRLAILAFALSSWFEGYSQLRHSVTAATFFDSPYFSFSVSWDGGDGVQDNDGGESRRTMNPFMRWLSRKGRRVDDLERGIMGTLDVITSLGVLHTLRTGPLLPFLVSPLLTTLPLPMVSHERVQSLRWTKLLLASLSLCLFRELERVGIAQAVSAYRRFKDAQDGVYTGSKVVVRGAPLPPARSSLRASSSSSPDSDLSWMYESDEEEETCIICTGNAGHADLSQSISSISSHMSSSSVASTAASDTGAVPHPFGPPLPSATGNLGPLEAFCTVAPTKHLAHRGCILRWHAAYNESQRQRVPPALFRLNDELDPSDVVRVVEDRSTVDETLSADERAEESSKKLRRAKSVLKLAGFEYLLDSLRVVPSLGPQMSPSPSIRTSPLSGTTSIPRAGSASTIPRTPRSPFSPSLTLSPPTPRRENVQTRPSPSMSPLATPSLLSASTSSSSRSASQPLPLPRDHLATLRTAWPPCPGCRSPIDLHFCAAPTSSSPSPRNRTSRSSFASDSSSSLLHRVPSSIIRKLACFWTKLDKKNTTQLVTGRTIALSLSAQFSFLLTLLSMLHARERANMALEAMEAEMRAHRTARPLARPA